MNLTRQVPIRRPSDIVSFLAIVTAVLVFAGLCVVSGMTLELAAQPHHTDIEQLDVTVAGDSDVIVTCQHDQPGHVRCYAVHTTPYYMGYTGQGVTRFRDLTVYDGVSRSRTAGANDLTNYDGYLDASGGGQVNYNLRDYSAGDVLLVDGNVQLGDTTSDATEIAPAP